MAGQKKTLYFSEETVRWLQDKACRERRSFGDVVRNIVLDAQEAKE